LFENGFDLKGARSDGWSHIASQTGGNAVPKMGLLAWNYDFPAVPLRQGDLNKAGIIILVKDRPRPGGIGLEDAIRSGLVIANAEGPEEPPPESSGTP
jgi:hypothetical protein